MYYTLSVKQAKIKAAFFKEVIYDSRLKTHCTGWAHL
jgi:hypothetical protein